MVVLVAAQLLVFNHIHLFGYATPLPYVYLVLSLPMDTERWEALLWGFTCGLLADITMLTPGVGAFALTLTAFMQPTLLKLMAPKDAVEDMRPSYSTMGFWSYSYYAGILTLQFSLAYFCVLAFNFHHFTDLAISFFSSWALTFLLCLIFQGFRKKRHE